MDRMRMEAELIGRRRIDELRREAERERRAATARPGAGTSDAVGWAPVLVPFAAVRRLAQWVRDRTTRSAPPPGTRPDDRPLGEPAGD
jgi:hypothetical protein